MTCAIGSSGTKQKSRRSSAIEIEAVLRKNSVQTPSQLDVTHCYILNCLKPQLRSWFGKLLIAEVFSPDRILADHNALRPAEFKFLRFSGTATRLC